MTTENSVLEQMIKEVMANMPQPLNIVGGASRDRTDDLLNAIPPPH